MIPPLPEIRPGAIALLSGGVDSAVMTGRALDQGDTIWPLYVRQGFLWEEEEIATSRQFLNSFNGESQAKPQPLTVVTLGAPAGFEARWAMDRRELPPSLAEPDETVYLPGRNMALLTQAAMLAYAWGVERIMLGILMNNPFPDATPAFFRSFERTVFEAMRWPIRVETPLAQWNKTDVIRVGSHFALEHTTSCARPGPGTHCGRCNKCYERWRAFRRAGVADPARYAKQIGD